MLGRAYASDIRARLQGQPPQQLHLDPTLGELAIRQWQSGVVAVGARRHDGTNQLRGSGWLVDVPSGLVCTSAHVILDCVGRDDSSVGKSLLDPAVHGVAIGVGIGEQIRWWCRATLRYYSMPGTDYPAQAPSSWPAAGDALRLDIAVLQLVNWDGSPLNPSLADAAAPQWHRTGEGAIALPLGRSADLSEGDTLVMLGYGQDLTVGRNAPYTSTTCRGYYSGRFSDHTGEWLKADMRMLSGHGGGPVLNRHGEVIGLAIKSSRETSRNLSMLRSIEAVVAPIEKVRAGVNRVLL